MGGRSGRSAATHDDPQRGHTVSRARAHGSRMGIAAAMGGWSARHRWAAVGGWLLFVVLVMVVGQAAGRHDVDEDRAMPGEVSQAATILDDAGLQSNAGEMVL